MISVETDHFGYKCASCTKPSNFKMTIRRGAYVKNIDLASITYFCEDCLNALETVLKDFNNA